MQSKYNFFPPSASLNKKPLFIILSGVPCTGKSTWREQMLKASQEWNIPVRALCADDIAYELRDELNKQNKAEKTLTYSDICTSYRSELEAHYKKKLSEATNKPGIVILDRTYLTASRRKEVLDLLKSDSVHIISFMINHHELWKENLQRRNENEPEKKITEEIIQFLTKDASLPRLAEGFASIMECTAVGEPKWEEAFGTSVEKCIALYKLHNCVVFDCEKGEVTCEM